MLLDNSALHKPFVFKLTCKEDGVHIVNDIGSLDLVSESTLLLSKILQAQPLPALQLALPAIVSPPQPSSSLPLANDGLAMDVAAPLIPEPQAIVNVQLPAAHAGQPDDSAIFDSDVEQPKSKKQRLKKVGKSAISE